MRNIKCIIIFLFLLNNYFVDSKLPTEENNISSNEENNDFIINDNKFLGHYKKIAFNKIYTFKEEYNKYPWFNIKNLEFFTYIHLILSFLIMPALSIILIIIDMKEDKTIKKKMNLPSNEKVKKVYNLFKNSFITKSKYFFSWFLFKYHFPITSIIFIYSYNHPRYIRLILYIIKILFNTLLTSILYKIAMPDKDIEINFANILLILILSAIISIIIELFMDFTIKFLFEFDSIRRDIFKKKLETLRRYIYYDIKKDILFNSKWHLIRNRMIAYYRLCGSLLLSQVKKNKYQKYVKNKFKNLDNDFSLISQNSENNSNNSSIELENLNKTDIMSNKKKKKVKEIKNEIAKKRKSISNISKLSSNKNDKEKINNFRISKGVESFSFSKFGINNMKLKTVKKLEDIKNRYINKKKDIKFDETQEIDIDTKIYENLDIESLEGFTYISTNTMIDKLNNINAKSNKMLLNILTGIILLIILMLTNFSLMIMQMGEGYKSNEKIEVSEFLLTVFFITIFVNFYIHRIICLFIAFSIHKFYGKKKRNCCYKLIFEIFLEKYIIYLYRIRLLISKYEKEFNFMEK